MEIPVKKEGQTVRTIVSTQIGELLTLDGEPQFDPISQVLTVVTAGGVARFYFPNVMYYLEVRE